MPTATPCTKPAIAGSVAALVILAMAALSDVKVTSLVKSTLLPSELVPVTVSCKIAPAATDGVVGARAMELKLTITVAIVVVPLVPEALSELGLPEQLPKTTRLAPNNRALEKHFSA